MSLRHCNIIAFWQWL